MVITKIAANKNFKITDDFSGDDYTPEQISRIVSNSVSSGFYGLSPEDIHVEQWSSKEWLSHNDITYHPTVSGRRMNYYYRDKFIGSSFMESSHVIIELIAVYLYMQTVKYTTNTKPNADNIKQILEIMS